MSNAESPYDVAIIGGDASGPLVAAWLLRLARAPLRLVLLAKARGPSVSGRCESTG
jgi:glycine/D-amino acid oxidase-like deaminating enzyme